MPEYREMLRVDRDDASYSVGFHDHWDRLRLNVYEWNYPEDGGDCGVELWLTHEQAEQLAEALKDAVLVREGWLSFP